MWRSRNILDKAGDLARATVFPTDLSHSKRQFVAVYLLRLLFLVGRRLWRDNCPRQAAALAYQTVLSLVPLLAVSISFATLINLAEYQTYLTQFAAEHLMPASADKVTTFVIDAANGVKIRALGIFGLVGLVVLSTMLLFTIEGAINEIFRCPKGRPLYKRLLIALLLLTVAPLAMAVSIYFTGRLVIIPGLFSSVKPLLPTILALFAFYKLIPNTRVHGLHAFAAAVTTSILLELLKVGFAVYVKQIGDTLSYLYGTFAIMPLAMVWIYMAWVVFLFGAELAASLHEVREHDKLERRISEG